MELIIKPATDEETIEALKNTIERLQQQIKKMKCCQNCKHHDIEDYTCNIICSISGCNKNSKWELSE